MADENSAGLGRSRPIEMTGAARQLAHGDRDEGSLRSAILLPLAQRGLDKVEVTA